VESKWGWLGRYLHPPAAQRYGTLWTFHRSDRTGHRLRGLEDAGQGPADAFRVWC
jgi:hypothetical protein